MSEVLRDFPEVSAALEFIISLIVSRKLVFVRYFLSNLSHN